MAKVNISIYIITQPDRFCNKMISNSTKNLLDQVIFFDDIVEIIFDFV
jgi:hypothetical protein